MRLLAIALTSAAFAGLSAPALAYPPWVLVIRDCADDGKIDGTYRHQDYAQALKNVPSDGGEYSDCANAIRHALTGGSGKSHAAPAPPNPVVTDSGAVAASADDVAQLQAVVAAADAGERLPAASGSADSSPVDAVIVDLGPSAGPPYRVDTTLLAIVLAAGVLAISGASLGRRLTTHR